MAGRKFVCAHTHILNHCNAMSVKIQILYLDLRAEEEVALRLSPCSKLTVADHWFTQGLDRPSRSAGAVLTQSRFPAEGTAAIL